jgi:hypothetical protein
MEQLALGAMGFDVAVGYHRSPTVRSTTTYRSPNGSLDS